VRDVRFGSLAGLLRGGSDVRYTPEKGTFAGASGMSAKGQKRTLRLLDHLVGTGEHCRRNCEAERLGRFEIDH
jgi:hypothetical protein